VQDGAYAARPTVLAVDDEPAVREALRLVLEDYFDVVLAPDGRSALDLLRGHRVDVVLLDLLMPEMHGLDVLPQLLERDPSLAVVVLTAVVSIASVVRAMKLGAWNYIAKPWDNDELVELVRQAAMQRQGAPGVLLLGGDPARLAPLELALERHIPVATSFVGGRVAGRFPVKVVVLDSETHAADGEVDFVRKHFPSASVFVLTEEPYRLDLAVQAILRLAGTAGRMSAVPEHVTNAIAFMVAHYTDYLTVGDIARGVSLSDDRLAHVFKEATGYAVREYLMRFRMAIARRLLVESDAKLDAVASRVGFADASTLSKTFFDLTGVRPGEFRRSLQRRG